MTAIHTPPTPAGEPAAKGRSADLAGSLFILGALAMEMLGNPALAVILAIIAHAYITKGRQP